MAENISISNGAWQALARQEINKRKVSLAQKYKEENKNLCTAHKKPQ